MSPRILPPPGWLRAWGPVVALMAFVALLSLMPAGAPGRWANLDKLAHVAMYLALGLAVARALSPGASRPGAAARALALVVGFGAAMEALQSLVGRGPSWGDLVADALGAAGGVAVWTIRQQGKRPVAEAPR